MITAVTAFLILFGSTFVVSAFRVSGGRADSLAATRDALNGSSQGVDRSGVLLREDSPADYWHALAVKRLAGWRHAELQRNHARGQLRALRATLLHRPSVSEAINLACQVYGNCQTMWRRARCESHLNPLARNGGSGSSGLFQFLYSTFRSTPFGGFSIWSPYANAMAAGWMMGPAHRGGEWSCR